MGPYHMYILYCILIMYHIVFLKNDHQESKSKFESEYDLKKECFLRIYICLIIVEKQIDFWSFEINILIAKKKKKKKKKIFFLPPKKKLFKKKKKKKKKKKS